MQVGRILGALGLLGLLLLHTFSLTAVWVEFQLRQATIERTLCENRDRPELACHGHCVLRKRLHQTEEAASSPVQLKSGQLADTFLPPAPLVFGVAPTWPPTPARAWAKLVAGAYDRYEAAVFQPPDSARFVS